MLQGNPINLEIESDGTVSTKLIETSEIPIYRINPASMMRQLGFVGALPEITTEVARVAPGRIMFELDGVSWDLAQEAFKLAAAKLPIDTKIVRRLGDTD